LYGLHPGNQITEQHNAEFLKAAQKTIDYRLSNGGGHTGWSRAWIINFFARLKDGDKAYEKGYIHGLIARGGFEVDMKRFLLRR